MTFSIEALIRTKNEEHHIRECIENAQLLCERITVLDQGSTDRTVELAKAAGVPVVDINPSWHVNRSLRLGVETSTADWILCLDADMRLTLELVTAFRRAVEEDRWDAVDCRVKTRYFGRWIEHGNLFRPHFRKLYRRTAARQSKPQHHKLFDPLPADRALVLTDKSVFFLHYGYEEVSEFVDNVLLKYARNEGREFWEAGARPTPAVLFFRPVRRFLIDYVFRGGWRDGAQGLMVYGLFSCYEFVRWASCYDYGRRQVMKRPKGVDA
jgi:glycosyltransferase involved in cell wall biosynthesis